MVYCSDRSVLIGISALSFGLAHGTVGDDMFESGLGPRNQ
jgi:hypothetical protein